MYQLTPKLSERKSVTRYDSGAIHKNRQNFKIQIQKFRETEITVGIGNRRKVLPDMAFLKVAKSYFLPLIFWHFCTIESDSSANQDNPIIWRNHV